MIIQKYCKSNIFNYAMTDRFINSERGNMPLANWISIHPEYLQNMKNYVKKYWNKQAFGEGASFFHLYRLLQEFIRLLG